MSLTTTQILNLARNKMLEQGTEIISDENALIFANLTYEDLIKRTQSSRQMSTAQINFTAGVGSLPTDFGAMTGDAYVNASSIFPKVSPQDFIRQPLEQAITIEGNSIKVFPDSTPYVFIKYYPSYNALTTSQNPQIDSYYHECLVYGLMSRAYEDLQDQELAKYYDDKYEALILKKTGIQSKFEESNQNGGTLFNFTKLI